MFNSRFSPKAQGTIEYLVIVGIVVVISLAVVGVMTGVVGNNSAVGTKISDIQNKTTLVALSEILSTPTGNYLLVIKNNSDEFITLTDVNVNGIAQSNLNRRVAMLDKTNVTVVTGVSCTANQTTIANISIKYTSNQGLSKTQNFNFSCTSWKCNWWRRLVK